ncbi:MULTISPECIES: hypothetical protein [unclassified Microbacterium]|uniref:hypothetical protein n=1 Tax=unclassified Microbacterium TaxID=2609290 RepID=UPI00365A5BEC
MSKQLITLIGALVSIAIVVLAVVFGVLPLVGQSFTALGSTSQVASTNAAYQAQIAELQKQKQRKSEIDASVDALRGQIPASPELDQVFDVIAASAQASGATLTSATRGDLAVFASRPAPVPAGPGAAAQQKAQAAPQPQPTPQTTTGTGAVGDAKNVAAQADANAAQTSQAGAGAAVQTGTSAPTTGAGAATATREQIPVSVVASVPDEVAAQAFLDGLRASARLLAVDKATLTPGNGGLEIRVDLLAFLTAVPTAGASK